MKLIGLAIFQFGTVILALALILAPIKTPDIGYQGAAINTRTGEILVIGLVPVPLKKAAVTPTPSSGLGSEPMPTPKPTNLRVSR